MAAEKMIDLHVHTTCSDGVYTPSQIIDRAQGIGLGAVAITDHDTVAGIDEALAHAEKIGMEVVPGIELSAESPFGSYHILGYYMNHKDPDFTKVLDEILDFRDNRNPKIIAKLNALGIDITMDEVKLEAGTGVVGRPHMAKVLLKKQVVATMQEAFNRFLAEGAAAYVDKKRVSVAECINLIVAAGGIPVWAHPGIVRWNDIEKDFEAEVARLAHLGLRGIEARYGSYSNNMTKRCLAFAQKYSLLVTGGSDYHGGNKKNVELGRGTGRLAVPYSLLTKLKAARDL